MTHRKERALSPHIFPMELCAHPCFSLWAIKTKQKLAVIKTDLFIWKWKPFNRIQPSLHKKAKTYKRGSSLKTKGKRLWRHPLLVGIYCPAGNFCNQLATSENEHICLMELFICFALFSVEIPVFNLVNGSWESFTAAPDHRLACFPGPPTVVHSPEASCNSSCWFKAAVQLCSAVIWTSPKKPVFCSARIMTEFFQPVVEVPSWQPLN